MPLQYVFPLNRPVTSCAVTWLAVSAILKTFSDIGQLTTPPEADTLIVQLSGIHIIVVVVVLPLLITCD